MWNGHRAEQAPDGTPYVNGLESCGSAKVCRLCAAEAIQCLLPKLDDVRGLLQEDLRRVRWGFLFQFTEQAAQQLTQLVFDLQLPCLGGDRQLSQELPGQRLPQHLPQQFARGQLQ